MTNTVPRTIAHLPTDLARRHGDDIAMRALVDGDWQTWTYTELADDVERVAATLLDVGVAEGDRVAIFSGNRPEWTVADLAIQAVGAIVVPIYFNAAASDAGHVVQDSGARVVIVAGQRERDLLAGHDVVLLAMDPTDGCRNLRTDPTSEHRTETARRRDALDPEKCATIVYTSGTTGRPRGAMLSSRAFTYQMECINALYDLGPGDQSLCFLPLAHVFERVWTYCVLANGALNTYVTRTRDVADLLARCRPNLFVSVPKFYDRVLSQAQHQAARSPLTKAVFTWAVGVGTRAQYQYLAGWEPSWWTRLQVRLADRLVFRRIRDALGGPKKVLISGGAPLRREVEEFVSAVGLRLGQGYGLTETAPVMTFFEPSTWKLGTVGYCLPGSELRLGEHDEILYRGPNVMLGYWHDDDATAQAIDADGWFHTGDVGHIDEQGYVTITDRLKDIIVTNGGKNVAPQPIEALLLSDPLFEQAVVLGNDRPFLTAILQPTRRGLEELGEQLALQWDSIEDLLSNQKVVDEVNARVRALTASLPHVEQIRALTIMHDVITPESGLLTPTFKVKRREVEARFKDTVDAMYDQIRRMS